MAYIVDSDMRNGALYPYITIPDSLGSARVTAMIAGASMVVDGYCNDHFESEAATLELDGSGTTRLYLPKRFTAVSAVKTRDALGVLTAEASTVYRHRPSLESSGSRAVADWDWLEIIPTQSLAGAVPGNVWPEGPQTVQVAGSAGWITTPELVKWATAQLVWSWCQTNLPAGVEDVTGGGITIRRSSRTESTGLPEVDAVLVGAKLRRGPGPFVA